MPAFWLIRKSDKVRLSMFAVSTRMQPRFIQAGFLFTHFSPVLELFK